MRTRNFLAPSRLPGRTGLAIVVAWAAGYFLLAAAVQWYVSYPLDMDTAYHAAVGRLIREHGILHAFPWTPFSWLSDHYADKELLFHLLFVPFSGMDWIAASRIVGTVCGGLLLLTFSLILRSERIPLAGLWSLVPLLSSGYFVFRFGVVRPFIIAIGLTVVMFWAVARNRTALVAVTAFLFPWSYVAFWQLPAVVLFTVAAARLLSQRRVCWEPAAAAAAGIVLGIAVHPNAANLLDVSWINMTEMLFHGTWGGREGFEMGRELRPFLVAQWRCWLAASVIMAGISLFFGWRERRRFFVPFAFALAALVFGVLTVTSGKFSEYFIPFSALALALAAPAIPWRHLAAATAVLAFLYTAAEGWPTIAGMHRRAPDMPPEVALLLQQQIPPGSQVFTTDWDFTGLLLLTLPDRRFMVALDPTFFYARDPELYRLWYRSVRDAPPGSAEVIRRRFRARYILGATFEDRLPFFRRISSEPGVKTLLVSDSWMLFDLGAL